MYFSKQLEIIISEIYMIIHSVIYNENKLKPYL